MFISDINRVIEQVSRDRGIAREILIDALEEALRSAARKKFGNRIDIEIEYNEEMGEIEVFQFKEVAEEVTEPALQVSLDEGRELDPDCEIGDSLGTKMDTSTFGRIAAQSAKQVIIQKMKDAERDAVFASFIDRKGEVVNGIVQRVDRGDIIVNMGNTEAVLPSREQVHRENYRRGDRLRALILDVLHDSRGPQIILSRTHPSFLINLFRTEVPEISEGLVEIKGAAREPGIRAKFAVASHDADVDPVGACVGMKGSRVQNVVQELRGEKIDIIPWHIDSAKYVCNALSPAEISRVIIDEGNRAMEVIVPDEFLSIAIGKRGQNVRLASKLTGWHLDVKSESKYSEAMKDGYDSLLDLPGVGMEIADALYERGLFSAEEISAASIDDLLQVEGMTEESAMDLIDVARNAMGYDEAAFTARDQEPGDEEFPEEETLPESEEESLSESEEESLTESEEESLPESEEESLPENEEESLSESEEGGLESDEDATAESEEAEASELEELPADGAEAVDEESE